jgi:hypothetical protein
MQSGRTLLYQLVMLLLRQLNALPMLPIDDVEHALSVLLSNKKVFVVMSAVTNRKSI